MSLTLNLPSDRKPDALFSDHPQLPVTFHNSHHDHYRLLLIWLEHSFYLLGILLTLKHNMETNQFCFLTVISIISIAPIHRLPLSSHIKIFVGVDNYLGTTKVYNLMESANHQTTCISWVKCLTIVIYILIVLGLLHLYSHQHHAFLARLSSFYMMLPHP